MPLPVGQDPGDQAQRAQRLRQVPGQAVHQAEITREQEPPQRVPAGLLGQHAAEVAERGEGRDVDRHEHVRHRGVLAERKQPRQRGVADPHEPVRRVHGDAERRRVQVGGVQRQPVVELAVVAGGAGEDGHPARHLPRVAVHRPDPEQIGDVAVGQQHEPALDRGQRGQEGDDPGHGRPVRDRPELRPADRRGRLAGRG